MNWTLPIKYIPYLDFISVKALYRGDYNWSAASLNTVDLGNVIQNGQRRQLNGDLNFETLYNKSKFLKKINSPARKKKDNGSRRNSRVNSDNADDSGKDSKGGRDNKTDSGKSGKGGDGSGGDPEKDSKAKEKKKRGGEPSGIARALIRPIMMLRKARASYSENFSTIVPGYLPESEILGMSPGFEAPGWDFVAGWQPDIRTTDNENDWLTRASNKGWMSNSVFLNQQVQQNYTQAFDARVTVEPYDDWRIELLWARSFTENKSLYFKDTLLDVESEIRHVLPREIGSFSISYFAMNTMFEEDIVGLFKKFEDNRPIISERIGVDEPPFHAVDGSDYHFGYGRAQQDVLIPSFLAAYTNKDPNTVEVSNDYTKVLFKEVPRPNWNVTYDGLAKLPAFSNVFSRFSISHGYQSTLTVNSFNTANTYEDQNQERILDLNSSYYSRFEIPAIVISEQFVPLLGIRMELRSGLAMDLEFKKSRLLSMSFITYQLSETKTSEYVVGLGYRMRNVVLFKK